MITDVNIGENIVCSIEILCDEPCCEAPPCSPLTMGKQIPDFERTILMMCSDPQCWFRYRIRFDVLDNAYLNQYLVKHGEISTSFNHYTYENYDGWDGDWDKK